MKLDKNGLIVEVRERKALDISLVIYFDHDQDAYSIRNRGDSRFALVETLNVERFKNLSFVSVLTVHSL